MCLTLQRVGTNTMWIQMDKIFSSTSLIQLARYVQGLRHPSVRYSPQLLHSTVLILFISGSFENLLAYQLSNVHQFITLIDLNQHRLTKLYNIIMDIMLSYYALFIMLLCYLKALTVLKKKKVYRPAVLCGELVRDSNANRRRCKGFE